MPANTPIYQLKITLNHIQPQIWRRVLVPGNATLEDLHHVIQAVMPWQDYHLHHFKQGEVYYGIPFPEHNHVDSRQVTLKKVLANEGDSILYEYDFGDSWRHEITLERIQKPKFGQLYPVCIAGERACPPEDCGGVPGYYFLLEALSNPQHENHERFEIWSGNFQPEIFDLDKANARLRLLTAESQGLMRLINRDVVVIKPKQPMLDWINSNDPEHTPMSLDAIRRDCTVLLTPEFDSPEDIHAFLHDLKPLLFEKELASWYTPVVTWPEPRTAELFDEWFDLEIHSMVWDMAWDEPIEYE